MKILTGIDLPFTPNCGSIILVDDLYSNPGKNITVRYLGLESTYSSGWSKIKDIKLLNVKKVFTPEQYPSYVKQLTTEINKQISEFNPDVIHIQHLSFGMALAFSELSLPKVTICHGTDVQYAQNSDFHRNNMTEIYKKSDAVIFPTEEIRKEFYKLTSLTGKDYIVPWGLPDEIHSRSLQSKKFEKKLLYAGRLDSNKNVKLIVDAIKYVEDTVTLAIIGEGDQKEALQDVVANRGLTERVTFIDFLPRKLLWEKFSEYNALILPTEKIEAFGLTTVEAQLHGLPVLYSKTNGLIEVLGESGISFSPNNAKELAECINTLFQSNETYQDYVKLGIENASKYKISTMREAIFRISQDVINSKGHAK